MTSRADRFAALLGADSGPARANAPLKPTTNDHFCETAPAGMEFSPVLGVSKFPYKYINRAHNEAVAKGFFSEGKFWDRKWDLYYVWSPYFDAGKPVIFVPLKQFLALIKDIDNAFPSYMVSLPEYSKQNGLVCVFGNNHPYLRPRFLGHSSSKDDYDRLQALAPSFGPDSSKVKPSNDMVDVFQDEMEAAMDAGKNKGKISKAKKQEARLTKQHDLISQFQRTQSMLGLSPSSKFEGDIIFIAVDVESFERNHNIITEIGIATLDTRDLQDKPSGLNGKAWHPFIRARHFRIDENKHYHNHEFVHGCAENFEFGTSEFVSLKDAPRAVASCFKHPFSDLNALTEDAEKRSIVFLGHDTKQDVTYLRDLGYDPTNLSNLVEFQDTAAMYRAFSGQNQTRALGFLLYELGFESWNSHNAGNDAVYTVQAMLGLCVKDASMKAKSKAEVVDDDDEGGVSLLPEVPLPKKSLQEDWEVVETTAKLDEWEM